VFFICGGIASPAYLPEFHHKAGARNDGIGRSPRQNQIVQKGKERATGKISEQDLTERCGMRGEFTADFTLIARAFVDKPLRAGELRGFRAVDHQHLAAFQHADSSGEAGLAGNPVEHRLGAGAETQFAKRSMSQRDRFQADFIAARVAVARQIPLALEPRKNPRTGTLRNPQPAADFGVPEAARGLLDYFEQGQRAFQRIGADCCAGQINSVCNRLNELSTDAPLR
jgi:hypothetical protein